MDNDMFLFMQGHRIVNALRREGYLAHKLNDQLAWGVCQPDQDWWLMLTFIPRPVAQWRLLPATSDEMHQKIYSIIEQAIGGRR